jgi:hypothetical protein
MLESSYVRNSKTTERTKPQVEEATAFTDTGHSRTERTLSHQSEEEELDAKKTMYMKDMMGYNCDIEHRRLFENLGITKAGH